MSTKSKIAIVLFVLQIISTAGIVIGTSKDYLGALAYAVGLSVFMIIAAVLVLVDNKKMYDKIKNSKSDFFVDETIKQTEQESEIEEDEKENNNTEKNITLKDKTKLTPHQETAIALLLTFGLSALLIFVILFFSSL